MAGSGSSSGEFLIWRGELFSQGCGCGTLFFPQTSNIQYSNRRKYNQSYLFPIGHINTYLGSFNLRSAERTAGSFTWAQAAIKLLQKQRLAVLFWVSFNGKYHQPNSLIITEHEYVTSTYQTNQVKMLHSHRYRWYRTELRYEVRN